MKKITFTLLFTIANASFKPKFKSVRNGLVANGSNFTLDGKPLRILSGAMHYFRIPHQYWRDRLSKFRGAGLNTVETYVAWNLHEPEPFEYNFEGDLDLVKYIQIAQDVGLNVLLRPGPYICAEWEWGGLPFWLLKYEGMTVRSTKSLPYLYYVQNWMEILLELVKPLQYTYGGPIIAVQVENEYASYNVDPDYLPWMKSIIEENGVVELLYTSDGGSQLVNPNSYLLPKVLKTVNFQNVGNNFVDLRTIQPNRPMMVMEYWTGWFDHWGQKAHSIVSPEHFNSTVRRILSENASINMYMFCGGTSFGFMAGANWANKIGISDTTSYDYDAPLTEFGDWTKKYNITRQIIHEYFPDYVPSNFTFQRPVLKEYSQIKRQEIVPIISLFQFLDKFEPMFRELGFTNAYEEVMPMEKFPKRYDQTVSGQDYGYALYSTEIQCFGSSWELSGLVSALEPNQTRIKMYLEDKLIQKFDLLTPIVDNIVLPCSGKKFKILAENAGRVNFAKLDGNFVGMMKNPIFNTGSLRSSKWKMTAIPMNNFQINLVSSLSATEEIKYPMFYKTNLEIDFDADRDFPADTFIDLIAGGWHKGVIFINGKNLGRYWTAGPQAGLYLPGPYLQFGENIILIFEEEKMGHVIFFSTKPSYKTNRKTQQENFHH